MANNEAGAFLNITPDVLKKLDSFDEKLEKIEKHAHTAADALKNGFGKVVIDTTKLENAITSLANKMNALNSAGNVVQNIGTSMNQVSKDATKAASSLSSVAQSINKVKPDNSLAKSVEQYRNISSQIEQVSGRQKQLNDIIKSYELTMSRIQSGKGGVIQAGQQQQVQAARQELESNNQLLATLKQKQQEIVNTNVAYQKQIQLVERLKTYNQEQSSLPNQRSQQTLADMRAYYSELEKSSARAAKAEESARIKEEKERERATAKAEKDADRKAKADERAAQRSAKAAADLAKQQELARRTTPQGALDYSKNTKSLLQNVQAIEYLKKARLSLNTTDKNYQTTLQQINQAIAKHNQALTEAGVKSQQLATRHRNLMDTAGQLSRQLALVFSVSQIEGYIKKLANVRGEFELQQRSLQAILQNKSQADQIFNKTVQLAVKSPFKIKELVSYTKQLAAYRIESSKLYDTTKRLADVSAGLGVDMGRIILAYGQVKAAAYLRGTEVRQFTEAGINLYGELQRYFEEVKGEAYTTAQIVDMISKRKVTFEDIENIFKRLTESGGLFYNMQEIQSETLIGKMRNLQDSIDVMLNSIGKSNEGVLKSSIDGAKTIIDNWETIAEITKVAAGILVLYKANSLLAASALGKMALQVYTFQKSLDVSRAQAFFTAIRAGFRFTLVSLKSIGTLIASNAYLIALTAIIYAVDKLSSSYSEYNRALEESNKKYNENMAPVNSLIAKYRELTDEANKAKAAQEKNFDFAKNRKDRENAVTQLASKFKEYGIKEDIGDVTKLSDKELEATLDRLNKKFREIQQTIKGFSDSYAKVNAKLKNNWFDWSEGISTDSKDLKKAGEELSIYSSRITKMLDIVGAHYFDLSSKVAGYYNEVKKGPDTSKNESEVEWILRALDALRKINSESKVIRNEFSNNKLSLFDIIDSKKNFDSQKKEFVKEVQLLKKELESKGITDPILISIALNKKAIEEEWTSLEENIARGVLGGKYIKPISEDSNKEENNVDPKHERDILAERISLIKELNKEYEKLNKVMGSKEAAKTVMERYEESLKNVNMPKSIIGDMFLPNKKNTAKALQEISKIITDFRKKQGAINDSYQLLDSDDVENIKKQLDKTKKNIEAMFNGLDLHKKLKDAGLSEAEVQQLFPGLAKTLDDVEKEMKAAYEKNFPKGEYLVADTDANKQYLADLDKLNQQRIKEQQNLVIELTKAYKTQLSDQLQLDRWYYEERAKIAKANLTEEQKAQYEANLQKQYGKKSDENTWKQFQNSDMYISMFENIESSSTRMLTAMRDKLASLRENLKDLPADQLKAIIKQQEKIDEMISKKNPFTGLTSGVKEYIQFLKQRKELEEKNIRANNAVAYYTEQKNIQSNIIQQKQLEYNKEVELNGVGSAKALNLKLQLEYEKKQLDIILKKLVAEGEITEETAEQIRNGQKLGKTLSDKFSEIGNNLSEFSSGITDVASNLENVFGTMSAGTADTISSIAEIAGGLGQTASGVARAIANPADIGGYIQAVGGIAKTIGSLFNIKDKKKEREIQRQIKNIETLGKAYDELKEKMEAAWSADDLRTQTKDTVANLDQQIASYQAMIKAEQDKKKTDKDRINEWNDAIKELEKTKQEILNQEKIEMGGIGGESEYKDAASSFVQAWLDAFNETGDGLKGLEENFDDFINNLFLKQASMRIANKFLEPLFQMIDLAVTEGEAAIAKGFDGSTDLTRQEMDKIVEEAKKQFPQLSEALEQLYNALGIKNNKTAELSSLTQSIQGITEREAEILESLLNSIRFFVSQQTTDISAIRALLDARYGLEAEYSDSNPMLVELRAQTGYLEKLSDYIGRVFAPSPNSKGPALRVIMQ
jgi:hypothetical protein|nr:MAG TPA: tail tape measure [Caudoviricetes sp.]